MIERPFMRYAKCDFCGADRRVTETIALGCRHVICIVCAEARCPACARDAERRPRYCRLRGPSRWFPLNPNRPRLRNRRARGGRGEGALRDGASAAARCRRRATAASRTASLGSPSSSTTRGAASPTSRSSTTRRTPPTERTSRSRRSSSAADRGARAPARRRFPRRGAAHLRGARRGDDRRRARVRRAPGARAAAQQLLGLRLPQPRLGTRRQGAESARDEPRPQEPEWRRRGRD